jgi:hypothetical protein
MGNFTFFLSTNKLVREKEEKVVMGASNERDYILRGRRKYCLLGSSPLG